MNAFGLNGLFIGITSISMAILVFFKNRKSSANKLWIVFTISVAIWGFGGLKISITRDPESSLLYWRLTHIGVIFIPVLFMHFVYEFLKKKERWPIYLAYLFGFFFLSINFSDLFIKNVGWVFDSFYYDGRPPTVLYSIFTILWFTITIISHILLFKVLRKSTSIIRNQIKYFFWATLIGFLGGGMSYLPVFGINIYPYGNFTVPLYPLIMTYAIVRHRLMDIRVIISKGVAYGSLSILTSFVFIPILLFMENYLFGGITNDMIKLNWWVVVWIFLLTFITSLFYPKIIAKAQERLRDIFFKEKYDYKKIISNLSNAIISILDIQDLLKLLGDQLIRAFDVSRISVIALEERFNKYRVMYSYGMASNFDSSFNIPTEDRFIPAIKERSEIVIKEEAEQMMEAGRGESVNLELIVEKMKLMNSEICIPMISQDKLVGIINMDNKGNRKTYSDEDIELLHILGNQAAIAIKNAQLYEEAITDYLTGVYNHKYFILRLDEEIERVKRYHHFLSLLMIDLDKFKEINDRYGHQIGDDILKKAAGILRHKTRRVDIVARYGGEEFSIILPETEIKDSQTVAERLRKHLDETTLVAERLRRNVEEERFITKDGEDIHLTISIGIAYFDGKDKEFVSQELVKQADTALYQAKKDGRNKVVVKNNNRK